MPLLARRGTSDTWSSTPKNPVATSRVYQERYEDIDPAREYNAAYRDRTTKRLTTRRELSVLARLLATRARCETLLDLPSGGGRLLPSLQPRTDLLIEADIALGQLLYGRDQYRGECASRPEPIWMTASAFHLPFKDRSVDAAVCSRLCHHLPTPEERERLIAELLRVSKRFVVMSFFDFRSLKNRWRRAREAFNGKPPKITMTVNQIAELARSNGFELVACPPLSVLFSGHRFALMDRRE